MKKIFGFILLLILVLSLAGCDMLSGSDGDGDGDGGNGSSGSGDNTPNASVEVSKDESERKFAALAENGYSISCRFSSDEENGEFTLGFKDNVAWIISDDSGVAIVEDGANAHYYTYYDGEYEFAGTVPVETGTSLFEAMKTGIANTWLYWANTYNGSLKKGADTTVAGRSCFTYSLDMSALVGAAAGVGIKYKIAVDKELGITMKIELEATADGVTESFNFEVTSLKLGGSVVIPQLPEPTEEPVDGDE